MVTPGRTLLDPQSEVFFSSAKTSRAAGREVKAGRARRIARGIYTVNTTESLDAVVRRNWAVIVGGVFPGAVVVDRTAFEAAPASDGSVFLDAGPERRSERTVRLPGLRAVARPGPGPVEGDASFMADLHLSGRARAYLDNLKPARASRARVRRTLTRREVEEKLDQLAARHGDGALNDLRDEARRIAPGLGAADQLDELERLVGALLGTHDAALTAAPAQARRAGIPYDTHRIELFGLLQAELLREPQPARPEQPDPNAACAFFEAYLSNFIEGTEFPIEEAEEIVFGGKIPPSRPQDAQDVLGTFRLISSERRRQRVPRSADDLLELLRENHRAILEARPEARPGEFKEQPNRAGTTVFVDPDHVVGTLRRGFDYYSALPAGFSRAAFAMFLISEVHPFEDGNGRLARVLMNAELSAVGEQRLVIPIVYRDDYLQSLRALSRADNPGPLVRVLDFAQEYAAGVDWATMETARQTLEQTGALLEPREAEAEGRRLRLPETGSA